MSNNTAQLGTFYKKASFRACNVAFSLDFCIETRGVLQQLLVFASWVSSV